VLGPRGVVGDAIVREGLQDDRISSMLAVSRRPPTHAHPKLRTFVRTDFSDFRDLSQEMVTVDSVMCALGLSWYQASGEVQYRVITHDYVMAFARVAAIANPSIHFCFVSGYGAAATGSRAWARIKAETEHDLRAVFGSRLTVFRPAYIYPVHGRETPYWGDTVMRPLMPFKKTLSRWITNSEDVGRAVLHCGTGGKVPNPATNLDIAVAAAAYVKARAAAVVT
jgi:uncharacterized protein YbjT (DUF2867 family)